MFNITAKRIGGLLFIRMGRISVSLNVQTPARFEEWLEEKATTAAIKALVEEFRA